MIDSKDRLLLDRASLFASVSLESVEHLFERCYPLTLERGEHLLEAGAANNNLYLILDGELRVYLSDRSLPPHAVLGAGDCVGEMSLLDGQMASALVLAAKDTRLLAVPRDVLWSLVDCSHGVARNLLAILSGRMRDTSQALVAAQSQSLEFEQASSVDALTGIHNRRWALEAFPRAIARCNHDHDPLCMVVADIDLFKNFNERFGHLAGDAVLRRMARRLADGLRPNDLIARYGGEEFLILLPHTTVDEALPIAERLRELVAIGSGQQAGQGVTLSCGVAQMFRGETLEELLVRLEAALRRAKEDGRDRVEIAG
ncbi:MAG: cyclic nucleotide-binding protein [Rhodocyclaceae bacterium]|nr:MAG: cyclic nucleotide-binding protein [Rhodocyclaceae bacterium]TND00774.1 MAG: cyclic nucleotide-binding protein [Rhodocyclaceae bacterium]